MKPPPDPSYRHRFPADIISHTVWLYYVFSLSFRDIELLLVERGIIVSLRPFDAGARNLVRALPNGCAATVCGLVE